MNKIDNWFETQSEKEEYTLDLEEIEIIGFEIEIDKLKTLLKENVSEDDFLKVIEKYDDNFHISWVGDFKDKFIELSKEILHERITRKITAAFFADELLDFLSNLTNLYGNMEGIDMDFDHWKMHMDHKHKDDDISGKRKKPKFNLVRLAKSEGNPDKGKLLATIKTYAFTNGLYKRARYDYCIEYSKQKGKFVFEIKYATINIDRSISFDDYGIFEKVL